MQKIEAIIQPLKLEAVRQELDKIGVEGLSVSDIDGYGKQKGHTEMFRGQEYSVAFTKKMKLEIITIDSNVDKIVKAIIDIAKTGKMGDGKIFVSPISKAYRIRTGETDDSALS